VRILDTHVRIQPSPISGDDGELPAVKHRIACRIEIALRRPCEPHSDFDIGRLIVPDIERVCGKDLLAIQLG
jgi:hypothetical protein